MTSDVSQLREQRLPETLEVLFTGRILRLERYSVRQYSGRIAKREVVRHPGGACVVAVDEDMCVTLVHQWRTPMDEVTLEIPAGKLDEGEGDPLACAHRELREETGLRAANFELLTQMYTSPGYSDERLYIYLATDLSQGEDDPDEGEMIAPQRMPLKEAAGMVMRGQLPDSKTALGLMMAAAKLGQL